MAAASIQEEEHVDVEVMEQQSPRRVPAAVFGTVLRVAPTYPRAQEGPGSGERAADIVTTIKGVRSVINLIDVLWIVRTDDQIRADVELALMDDPATDLFEIDVGVRNGTVILTGKVDSWQEKQLCILTAKGVIGVKEVKSDIKVNTYS